MEGRGGGDEPTFKVMEAHGPLASWSNWMPTALLLARPENLYEFTFLRLLGSDVRTTLPDLCVHRKKKKQLQEVSSTRIYVH